jgi:hypothetical protein
VFKKYNPDVVEELRKCGCLECKIELNHAEKKLEREMYDKGAW